MGVLKETQRKKIKENKNKNKNKNKNMQKFICTKNSVFALFIHERKENKIKNKQK